MSSTTSSKLQVKAQLVPTEVGMTIRLSPSHSCFTLFFAPPRLGEEVFCCIKHKGITDLQVDFSNCPLHLCLFEIFDNRVALFVLQGNKQFYSTHVKPFMEIYWSLLQISCSFLRRASFHLLSAFAVPPINPRCYILRSSTFPYS